MDSSCYAQAISIKPFYKLSRHQKEAVGLLQIGTFLEYFDLLGRLLLLLVASLSLQATTFDDDPRHQFVCGVKTQYAKEIEARKLNTNYHSIRLIDFARERLENEDDSCDWSLVIQCVVRGYGYRDGVSKTNVANDDECQVINSSYLLSCFYQAALGSPLELKLDEVYSPEKGDSTKLNNHINALNKVAAFVPKEVFELGHKNQASTNLLPPPTHSQWTAHERFWAVAGVIDPSIPNVLRTALNTQSAISFVSNLTKQLESAIKLAKPQHQEVVDLVKISQTIQLTLASGMDPTNKIDWEVIRKALFLALGVTSNPGTAGNTFLSTLYDCGKFYHQKTDPDEVKKYYFKLDAFARIFSEFWKGNYDLNQVIKDSDLSNYYTSHKRPNTITGSAFALLKLAYEEAAAITNVSGCKVELAASLTLHPKLNHELAFRALYPDLTSRSEHHKPSSIASKLMADKTVKLKVPFETQAINLVHEHGKWYLKSLKLDSAGKILKESILWTGKAKDSLNASIDDAQGTHLFNFDVDSNHAIIKAISSGYLVHIKGGHTTVGSSKELGIIESSAYPLDPDIYSNKEKSAILIEGEGYYGKKGILVASKESVWIQAPIINTSSDKGSLQASNTVNEGQEICAYKDVLLYSNHVNIANTKIFANQDVDVSWVEKMEGEGHLITHGSLIQGNRVIYINTGTWHVDTHTIYTGYPGTPASPPIPIITPQHNPWASYYNSVRRTNGQCKLEFGRNLLYSTGLQIVADPQTCNVLEKEPHTYGVFHDKKNVFTPYGSLVVTDLPMSHGSSDGGSRGGFGSFGGGSFGSVGSYTNSFQSKQSYNPSSLQLTNFNMSWSSRGGNNFGASLNFADGIGNSSTIGFKSYHSDLGSHTEFKSEFTPPNIYQQVRLGTMGIDPSKNSSALTLHNLCSMAILYGTSPKRMTGVLDKAAQIAIAVAIQKVRQEVAIGVTSTVTGTILAKKGIDDTQKVFDKKTGLGSTTGMPDPDDGDGGDEDDEKRKTKLKDGDTVSVDSALQEAEKFLGKDYRSCGNGRYVSGDNLRQVRMGDSDILGKHAGGRHMNFETLKEIHGKLKVIDNKHIFLISE